MERFLIIQTAFIGDVILATPLIEKLKQYYPDSQIDFLLRKGNEKLLENNPHVNRVYVLDKKGGKYANVVRMIRMLRKNRYDHLFNLQRFLTTGVIAFFARSKNKSGFDKNPLSFIYGHKVEHIIGDGRHEIERNMEVIAPVTDNSFERPRLYPSSGDYSHINPWRNREYICIAPASVWYTKQFPKIKWLELLDKLDNSSGVYLIGGPGDHPLCEQIIRESGRKEMYNFAGELSFLQTAALMEGARMNYVNDSAPLHIASAMNAPVTAVFCSTIPGYGFYPVSDQARIVETENDLYCRPCGLHGFKACPEGHFRCAREIDVENLIYK